ncbi:hypothetical protein ABZ614_39015 [Streptomyces sp. NPDC013178]|uniref:hypothetical protein n=1 Tax=Streptomyces sp. NPDC013178 TaxID=3155118 RepID=UPI0033F83F7A
MNGVVLVTGVMCAGKSTVAQAPARRPSRAAHVRGDVFRRTVTAREARRETTGYGTAWTVRDLDAELRTRTPRVGLWPATTELTVGETVEAIPAGRERARVA